jgi:MFS family permease
MNEPDPENQIQRRPTGISPAPLSSGAKDLSEADSAFSESKPRLVPRGQFFGAMVGMLMGALTGMAMCWLLGLYDAEWEGVLAGAVIGTLGGTIIGIKERKSRGDLVRPDIATFICVGYGLLPALLILLQGVGAVRGRLSGYVLFGAAFAGPMAGLLIGAFLDRAYEASRRKSWGVVLRFGIAGMVAWFGLGLLVHRMMQGPDPDDLAKEVRSFLVREWRKRPELESVKIQKVSLVRVRNMEYAGLVDALEAGQGVQFSIRVVVEGQGFIVEWKQLE